MIECRVRTRSFAITCAAPTRGYTGLASAGSVQCGVRMWSVRASGVCACGGACSAVCVSEVRGAGAGAGSKPEVRGQGRMRCSPRVLPGRWAPPPHIPFSRPRPAPAAGGLVEFGRGSGGLRVWARFSGVCGAGA